MIDTFVLLLVGALIILFVWALTGLLVSLRTKSAPRVGVVIDALQKWLYLAIFTGERFDLMAMDDLKNGLTGLDKKTIADRVYDLLPDHLTIAGAPIPVAVVKLIVSRDEFEKLVEDAYQSADAFILRNETYLKAQVAAWAKDHEVPLPTDGAPKLVPASA